MQKHPRQMSLRQFIPPVFVTTLVVFSLLAIFSTAARWLLAITMGAYVIANLGAALLTASRNGLRYLLYLPLAFAALHISYGAGFLYGIFKFASYWRNEAAHG